MNDCFGDFEEYLGDSDDDNYLISSDDGSGEEDDVNDLQQMLEDADVENDPSGEQEQQLAERGIIVHEEEPRAFRRTPKVIQSIEDCHKIENFDLMEDEDEEKYYVTEWEKKTKLAIWQNNPQKGAGVGAVGRRPTQDVIGFEPLKVKPMYSGKKEMIDIFDIFFGPVIRANIIRKTNERLQNVRQNKPNLPQSVTCDLTDQEFKAFIGLLFARGVLNWGMKDVRSFWQSGECGGSVIFGATMSRSRFQMLLTHLTFDKRSERARKKLYDKFIPIRALFQVIVEIFATVINSDDYLTIDETLYPSRGNFSFRNYIPNKPKKYGIKFQNLNAVNVPYIFASRVYAGKPSIVLPDGYYKSGKYSQNYSLKQMACLLLWYFSSLFKIE